MNGRRHAGDGRDCYPEQHRHPVRAPTLPGRCVAGYVLRASSPPGRGGGRQSDTGWNVEARVLEDRQRPAGFILGRLGSETTCGTFFYAVDFGIANWMNSASYLILSTGSSSFSSTGGAQWVISTTMMQNPLAVPLHRTICLS